MSSLTRLIRFTLGAGLVLAAFSTVAWARPIFTPEIDPGSMAGALTLLTGGVLMLTDRRSRSDSATCGAGVARSRPQSDLQSRRSVNTSS